MTMMTTTMMMAMTMKMMMIVIMMTTNMLQKAMMIVIEMLIVTIIFNTQFLNSQVFATILYWQGFVEIISHVFYILIRFVPIILLQLKNNFLPDVNTSCA